MGAVRPDPPPLTAHPLDAVGVDASGVEAGFRPVGDINDLCAAWEETPAKELAGGGLGSRELRRAAKLLRRDGRAPLDESEVARIAELAAAGLIGIDGASQTVQPLPAYDDWLALAIPDRRSQAARRLARPGLRPIAPSVLVSDRGPAIVVAALWGAGFLPGRRTLPARSCFGCGLASGPNSRPKLPHCPSAHPALATGSAQSPRSCICCSPVTLRPPTDLGRAAARDRRLGLEAGRSRSRSA